MRKEFINKIKLECVQKERHFASLNHGIQKTFRNPGIKTGMPSRDFLLRPSFFQPNPKQFKQSRLSTSKCTC